VFCGWLSGIKDIIRGRSDTAPGPILATRIPDFCDTTAFYAALSSAGVVFEKGRLDCEYYRELFIRATDAPDIEEILVSWGF
jgi:hypothetical protein